MDWITPERFRAVECIVAPEHVRAAQKVGQLVFPEADFIGREPDRGRPAEDRGALHAGLPVLRVGMQVAENLLESHLVELGLKTFDLIFVPARW